MCTSFTWRKNNVLTAMNFDNNNVPFSLSLKDPKQFIVHAGGAPCFGVNSNGLFINHLMVDSNGYGLYKRGKNVIHSIKLITDILSGKLAQADIAGFLSEKEIVNVPNNSCHSMISDRDGNVWIVEPGRGVIYSAADESPYCLMTNFSLVDYQSNGNMKGDGVERYQSADYLLNNVSELDVAEAFKILEAVKQSHGEWLTAFSMVYTQKENAVYYCHDGKYHNIQKYVF